MTVVTQEDRLGVLRYQSDHRDDFLSILRQLVELETPSHDLERQKLILEALESRFRTLGLRTRRVRGGRTGGHLLAYSPRSKPREKFQLLLGHCDTVWPLGTLAQMPARLQEQWFHGPGCYDMKAGLAMILFALQTVRALELELPYFPVVFINSDEEIGSPESTAHIKRLARGAQRAFVLEPSLGPDGELKTARKGVGSFHVKVKGIAAHAGLEPDRGASAILELSHLIQKLFSLSDREAGTTVNVGMIDGGIRPNVIAPESEARVDVRVTSWQEWERVAAEIAAIEPTVPGVRISLKGGMGRPPMEFTPGNRKLWLLARELGVEIGLELRAGTAGGGSDGNTTSGFTPTLDGLGAVGRGAHASDEAIDLPSTLKRTALLTLLLTERLEHYDEA